MAAATTPINNTERSGQFIENVPVAAEVIIFAGALVALNSSGYAVPASDTAALKVIGIAQSQALKDTFDNSAGSNGDISVTVKRGSFTLNNSGSASLTIANVGGKVFVADDNTVAASSSNSISAGYLIGFEDGNVALPIVDVSLALLG